MAAKRNKLIVVTGPTASGKSALAVSMARSLDTVVIGADSRQVYTGIPIATAMPTAEERALVEHRLIDFLPLQAYYSASLFEQDALREVRQVFASGRDTAILCGGSMMYVDALCNGIDPLPTVPEDLRASLMEQWKQHGDEWLLTETSRRDPAYMVTADRNNLKRVFHALEVTLTAGQPYSSLLTGPLSGRRRELEFDIEKIGIARSREELFGRINRRVLQMMDQGLEEEARRVYPLRHLNSLNTVGLKEMFAWFDGTMRRDEAVARIQKNTRVYAKKQLTWLKRDPDIRWIDPHDAGAVTV